MTINPLVAGRVNAPDSPWAGVWIAEDIELIARGVESGSWIDSALGTVGASLDGLALASDPVGALLQYGISWLIEHVKPLSEALDWLAGDPAQISMHALTWRNAAESLRANADGLAQAVRWDVTEWTGPGSDAYRMWATRREQAMQSLARASNTMAAMVEGAGALVGAVRAVVRDAVATVVSRLVVYAGELLITAGLGTPLVVEQVSALCASWAARISRWLRSLISSLRELGKGMRALERLIEDLTNSLRRGRIESPLVLHGRDAPRTNADVIKNGPGTPRTLNNVHRIADRLSIDLRGMDVKIVDDPEEIRYMDHMNACACTPQEQGGRQIRLGPASFSDEETLAATIAHEHHHVRQLRAGDHLRRSLGALEDEAYDVEGPALDRFRGGAS